MKAIIVLFIYLIVFTNAEAQTGTTGDLSLAGKVAYELKKYWFVMLV